MPLQVTHRRTSEGCWTFGFGKPSGLVSSVFVLWGSLTATRTAKCRSGVEACEWTELLQKVSQGPTEQSLMAVSACSKQSCEPAAAHKVQADKAKPDSEGMPPGKCPSICNESKQSMPSQISAEVGGKEGFLMIRSNALYERARAYVITNNTVVGRSNGYVNRCLEQPHDSTREEFYGPRCKHIAMEVEGQTQGLPFVLNSCVKYRVARYGLTVKCTDWV